MRGKSKAEMKTPLRSHRGHRLLQRARANTVLLRGERSERTRQRQELGKHIEASSDASLGGWKSSRPGFVLMAFDSGGVSS